MKTRWWLTCAAACLALLPSVRVSQEKNDRPIPVTLDTDIGGDIDDTWALALLLKSPELDVKLVVSDYE